MPLTAEQYLTALEITKQMKFNTFLQCKMCNELLFTVSDFIEHKTKFCEDTVVDVDDTGYIKPNSGLNEKISTLVVTNSTKNSFNEKKSDKSKNEGVSTESNKNVNRRKTDVDAKTSPRVDEKQTNKILFEKQDEDVIPSAKENLKITKCECNATSAKCNCEIPSNDDKPVSMAKTVIVDNNQGIYDEFDWNNCDYFDGTTCYVSEPLDDEFVKIEKLN
ncbi:uncharacterized protein LOC106668562 [Cimex lectularius]|uniref:Uncharacterized protein n=1 Tax=Cimex lectularius TaxID=79782 RepID=A0A8I6S3W7_CIMLE|nr:uncharacterized protein LOC106668562 [Cimex lectularius]XP_014252918.1 uncharacterized protein LOC106668562 [Cimex lectularius]XP_014252919.1 uncharacterized protein LOC106668562 [Cimex lectularius]XP_014252920.1 uncharacterized protein LOC106668562 [Cimex lectularius]XP_014252921.1 uncharacterized protein LOC106668562 [Cimex lectularius]XP_014252923.1 uncharacterized protein LOC106668562 [Cimex lectularius]XP_014252924.1 uncharacterized protein LOC106668562 [Cimex lectularius]XP_01425292